ncbi:D-serine ammonia-lyase [Deltaproteobacteria bacterium Smac51]|nr:D-serine ammonia-lyase [Deltaproteobacteria bacterium Smac51]
MDNLIAGKTLTEWKTEHPELETIIRAEEIFWVNPAFSSTVGRVISDELSLADIDDAEQRLRKFAPYIAKAFPETAAAGGLIDSELVPIPAMCKCLDGLYGCEISGRLYLKKDSHLPISGSVKARGGIYEILKTAEEVGMKEGLLKPGDDYIVFDSPEMKELLSGYSIVVGSTGNLGLSIGIMSARLGFRVVVHMSSDAKQWKKDMLRAKGAEVVEHSGDYGLAVASGRREAESDPNSHFVDDENSKTLFLGYAVAAKRLERQLSDMNITVDGDHPLFVYLPCGVGGAPGGITFGLRTVFGDAVHPIFAEPTHSPAMLLGLLTGRHSEVSVNDFGLDNVTAADGLAVGRPSGFVGRTLVKDIAGAYTVSDQELYRLLSILADQENIFLEPSALAGFPGPWHLCRSEAGRDYIRKCDLESKLSQATHIAWATGGGMVPEAIMKAFYNQGRAA